MRGLILALMLSASAPVLAAEECDLWQPHYDRVAAAGIKQSELTDEFLANFKITFAAISYHDGVVFDRVFYVHHPETRSVDVALVKGECYVDSEEVPAELFHSFIGIDDENDL